jgi:hypothetical protein
VSHKVDAQQWDTVDLDNYYFSCNGEQKYTGLEMLKKGTYNALLGNSMYYDSASITFEDSHDQFRKTLGDGFAWEVLEVFSGPPNVTFTWRHFGTMTHPFSCAGISGFNYNVEPSNKMIELFGMCKATVNDKLQIQDLQVYYDPNQFFKQLTTSCPYAPFGKVESNPSLPIPAADQASTSSEVIAEKKN